MIHRLLILFFFFAPLCFLHAQISSPSFQPKEEAVMIRELILKNHVHPRLINDDFSVLVFRQFIEALDPRGLYFTAADIKALSTLKTQIDNDLNGKGWAALPGISSAYKTRLQNLKITLEKTLKDPFNFQTREILTSSASDTLEFAVSEANLNERWKKWLKYQALSINYNSNKGTDVTNIFPDKEAALRQKVLAIEKRNINRILEHPSGFDNYMRSVFYNTILFCQDPHSYYMSVSGYQNMQSALSTEDLSFGIDLEEDEFGNIVVERLQPGGPAWRTNQIHKSDILTQLKWEGKDAMDLSGADVEEITDLLSSSNSSKLEFTFKKQSGETVTVILAKEKLTDGQNIVKSFILQGNKKIGYISLPGFYSEWENSAGSGCSNDVAKEIVKLKKENIQGLILDVRYNGGGSLQEGLDLAGIFINEGPLSVIKTKDEKPIVAKDMNRGTVYDGPLLLMVNRQSASASELLGAALQDYNRAVIVGNSSFGKATGQQIMPLDTNYNEIMDKTKSQVSTPRGGYAAVTVFKLYRLTGKSVQKKGLRPDIHLPDIFDNMEYSEANYPLAIENDSIIKKMYYTSYPLLPVQQLKQKSNARIKAAESFALLTGDKNNIRQLINLDSIPLNFQAYNKFAKEKSAFWKDLEKAQSKAHTDFSINSNLEDQKLLKLDTYGKEINTSLVTKLQQDIYLQESFSIMDDMINLQSK